MKNKTKFCQSCGMPLEKDFGTNSNKTRKQKFCNFCFQNGHFTDPFVTMEQMIQEIACYLTITMKLPEDEAIESAQSFIPNLKRWEK